MADDIYVNIGEDVPVRTDDVSGSHYQIVKLDVGGDGLSDPVIGALPVGTLDDVITITCSLDTSAYADGDILFDTQEIADAVRNTGDSCVLHSIQVLDKDDQGVSMDLIFLNANTSLGIENAAPSISDVNGEDIIGHVNIPEYLDLGGFQIATVTGISLLLKAETTSLYVAGITNGTPTHTASGIKIKFGLLRN